MADDRVAHSTKAMNSDAVLIRRARAEDVSTIVEFNTAMALETEQRTLDLERLRAGAHTLVGHQQYGFYILAETPQAPTRITIGQLMITYEWSDWRNGIFWWVQSVYVRPEWRRRGVYRAMHEHIAARAQEDPQVCGIRLYVEQNNCRAQTVYERLGLVRAGYTVFEQDFIFRSHPRGHREGGEPCCD